ncbi:SpoIIAA family protein [Hymenobacter crusticola]|uniref:STAS/SEC14 domain-containing protein n=1 Tax=Hymenobacter crusticola TaxID=1770526 RepID=A0A243W5A3_9BACT|nr:STAS/SEC14 domain-containing protein [Hymenobacter crusticola]OUJ68005.1 hypothetical protein BXP70_28315 [Hymenobacter crusticola]
MILRRLYSDAHLSIYFDSSNDWLYVEWMGELTLPVVQTACARIAQCFLAHPYPRVLNDNTFVTGISWSVAPWLIRAFLPHLRLAGVQQLAWVCSPSLPGLSMVQAVVTWLPHLDIAVFDELEAGAAWLQRGRRAAGFRFDYPYAPRTATAQTQLDLVVQDLACQAGLVLGPVAATAG